MATTDAQSGLYVWQVDNLVAATQAVNGQWHHLADSNDDNHIQATRIITDTRKIEAGDIFLAIVGENFDGHQFVEAAVEKGAVAAIVSSVNDKVNVPQLQVSDTRLAFGQIAAYRRQQHSNLKVIAITGSSGKTTVKEMLRSIFVAVESDTSQSSAKAEGHSTLITRGNLNNDFGVPMMLLELENQHQYAVLELGANHVGEIEYTAAMVKPDVACILNIGTAHLGEFGGRDNIAKTKAEIYQSLTQAGTAVVPADDDYNEQLTTAAQQYTDQILHFGWQQLQSETNNIPEVYATEVTTGALQSEFILNFAATATTAAITLPVMLPMAGQHNVSNALATAACAYALGVAPEHIARGLGQAQSTKGRLGRQQFGQHQIIDDTYNANPNSMRAAADVLAAQTGAKILVLGDIGELGDAAADEHRKLGEAIATKNINVLLCVGEFAPHTIAGAQAAGMSHDQAQAFATKADLLAVLSQQLQQYEQQQQHCSLLFKGSRSATMETLIDDLIAAK
ncbi:UDP-N-acetylmuramoyl-tripeptide--D-alanyl-D-alanine ligase [Psychrobacter sp. FDAARGOS_221]|uniref:UDP-N-acetylmuramoyl-tripeptide--D-alanyl-D- alanine ligase n=1 Tax=Psychrobacter sp. FDAARGOS_221 TaxID=1975705 RepID=UPI000BB57A41|nr:UDP-N-acetylmuramoyl-tripeptide--D-alanyl-D-alanine ligase [Psychrobacter sp. FDAARGOS_221]PNK60604.1 UDP-N-acetylmuramoyl-tripeptide--D-alanyl-D-alanine ligase [Psychrobacter sp. FDAARGOS_221]